MTSIRYFNGETELTSVYYVGRKAFGRPVDVAPTFTKEHGWQTGFVPVERAIERKARPSNHKCDARCLHATGKIMKCECSCGGKNHGRGAFIAEAA